MHKTEGQLRAYLDGELPNAEAQEIETHLQNCEKCQSRLSALRERVDAAASGLAALMEPKQPAGASPYQALASFQRRMEAESTSKRRMVDMLKRIGSGRWKFAWAGMAALIVLSLFVFYPPLRTAASEFLGVFRVRKFAALPINVSNLEDNPSLAQVLQTALAEQVEVTGEPTPPILVSSAEEASQHAGFDVRVPAWLPDGYNVEPHMTVEGGTAFRVTVDTDYLRRIQEVLDRTDVPVPANLDGAQVDVNVPKVAAIRYYTPKGMLNIAEALSPEINLPPNVDLVQLGEFGLRMAGLSREQAALMARTIDWTSTLVVPIPMGYAQYKEVTVAGASGLLVLVGQAESGAIPAYWMLILEKDGVVYGLEGSLAPEDLMAVAESMF